MATICLCACACDDGWHEGDPVDRGVTAWNVLPSLDETRLAVTLEPRKIHRDEQGVLTLGYQTTLAGPSIAVEHDATVATLDRGALDVKLGATRAWMLHSDVTLWEHMAPAEGPPRRPITHGSIIDRGTFARSASLVFTPPIEVPRVLGDTLFDVPTSGPSDIARDVQIRRRTDDGGADVLHAGRGFGVVTCVRTEALAVVFAGEDGETHAVAVRSDGAGNWTLHEVTLPDVAFDPRFVACDERATHVALFVGTGLAVFSIDGAMQTISVVGATPPAVLSSDGTAIVAVRDSDQQLVHATTQRVTPLGVVSAKQPATPAHTGDLAMFELQTALVVVDLATGALGRQVPAIRTSMFPFEMIAWRDRFVVQLATYGESWQDELVQLLVVDATTATPLPLPSPRWLPSLFGRGGDRLYLSGYASDADDAEPRLSSIDPASAMVITDEPLPLCDETAMLEERGCR